jgi:hypothetical protein
MLDLIEMAVHDDFPLSPFNLHIWLNMSIFFFKTKASSFGFVLRWRLGYFFIFYFYFVFSEKRRILTLALYFDEYFLLWLHILMNASYFGFIFWWMFHTLTSYFDEGFIFCLKNEGFTPDFVFWRSFLCLCILMKETLWLPIWTKVSLTSYFDEGFTLWLCISMKVLFLLWKMKASHFEFVFWWRFHFFSEKRRLETHLRILMMLSLTPYFDEGNSLTS